MSNSPSLLIVGSGPMAIEYAKVLRAKNITPLTVGRSVASVQKYQAEAGFPGVAGGIDAWLAQNQGTLPTHAIVSVGERSVGAATLALLAAGVKSILVEKPGGFAAEDIREVGAQALKKSAKVAIGYNRRFYAAVEAAKKIITEDGGVTSFNFEFTEWGHVISGLVKEDGVKEQWFLSNSTHVIDLAFHLGGKPEELAPFTAGGVDWHPAASIFAGAGRTARGALFSYQANWTAPGRWSVEMLTSKHRLIFRPMEKLQIQKIGSVALDAVDVDDELDQQFKPGLYKQVEAFLAGDNTILPSIEEQVDMLNIYLKIRGQ